MPSPSTILPLAVRIYMKFVAVAKLLQPFVLLFIRLAWGWELVESGYGHLTHFHDTVNFFKELNIPMPEANAAISGSTEMVGGILLMLGLGARLISIPLFFNFCVAYLTASHDKVAHIFSRDPSAIIDDSAFPFLVTSLIILAFGPGCFSLDAFIAHLLKRVRATPPAGDSYSPAAPRAA